MNEKELTDIEKLAEERKTKSNTTINALLIGVMIGIIIFSILKSSLGLFTLIPLYFIYKLVNSSKNNKVKE